MATVEVKMGGSLKGNRVGRKAAEPDQSTFSGQIAARVRTLRNKSGKTVAELAKAIGVSELTMYCYEANTRTLPPDLYPQVAKALGVTPRRLLPE